MTDAVSSNQPFRAFEPAWSFGFARGGRAVLFLLAVAAFLVLPSREVRGQGSLRYTLVDLPDGPSGDLWEYSYSFSGFNFQANQGFSIYFDYQFHRDLQNVRPSANPDWNMIAVQRDVLLQSPGYLDGLARVNAPTFQGPFQVAFVWLGVGVPGAQTFEIYDSNFQTIFTGTSVVPEPQSLLLALVGGLMLFGFRAARLRKRD